MAKINRAFFGFLMSGLLLSVVVFGGVFFPYDSVNAAVMSAQASASRYAVGSTFTVTLVLQSPGEPINAVSGVFTYPSELLSVVSYSKVGSFVSYWPQEPDFSNTTGVLHFDGLLLEKEFSAASGTILRVTFRAKKSGVATLTFPKAQAFLSDGSGKDVVTASNTLTLTLGSGLVTTETGPKKDEVVPDDGVVEPGTPIGGEVVVPEPLDGEDIVSDIPVSVTETSVYDPSAYYWRRIRAAAGNILDGFVAFWGFVISFFTQLF